MAELKFTGNCLRGSRPIISFDKSFDDDSLPQLQLVKQLFSQVCSSLEKNRILKYYYAHPLYIVRS